MHKHKVFAFPSRWLCFSSLRVEGLLVVADHQRDKPRRRRRFQDKRGHRVIDKIDLPVNSVEKQLKRCRSDEYSFKTNSPNLRNNQFSNKSSCHMDFDCLYKQVNISLAGFGQQFLFLQYVYFHEFKLLR